MHLLKCLIIDDEPLAQNVIENYLKNVAYIELIAKCDNAKRNIFFNKKRKKKKKKIPKKEFLFIEMQKDNIKLKPKKKTTMTQVPIATIEKSIPEVFLRFPGFFILKKKKKPAYTQHD